MRGFDVKGKDIKSPNLRHLSSAVPNDTLNLNAFFAVFGKTSAVKNRLTTNLHSEVYVKSG